MIPPTADVVHVWARRIDLDPDEARPWRALLAEDETARAARYHDRRDAIAFAVARGWMRHVLAGYLDIAPAELRFVAGRSGKPALAAGSRTRLAFNLSHSGGLALLAVTSGHPVGIDVERVRPMPADLAAACLAPGEWAALASLDARARDDAFMRCWTRKEAYLKALGCGLDTPLDDFEVSLRPGDPARLVSVRAQPEEAARWQIVHLAPAAGYCGAVAARRRVWSVVWMSRIPGEAGPSPTG